MAARILLEERKPVILTPSSLIANVAGKWDIPYIAEGLAALTCTVYASDTRHFRYWDEQKNEAGYVFAESEQMSKHSMSASQFRAHMAESVAQRAKVEGTNNGGSGGRSGIDGSGESRRYYLQTVLVDGVSVAMTDDFRRFDWEGLLATQQRLGWGELSSNLLLVGHAGNVTPAHYDEQQNLFAQVHGAKRVVLFPPEDFGCLYPFPFHHPCDRQSQVDLYAPDLEAFPRFAHAHPVEACLKPGEVLYIPQYWFHHIENLSDDCVSLNFWFKDQAKPQKVVLPVSPSQQLAMRRNIEKLVADKLGPRDARRVLPLLAQPPDANTYQFTSPPFEEVRALHEEVCTLLRHVMKPEEVQPWLAELTDRRFTFSEEAGLV